MNRLSSELISKALERKLRMRMECLARSLILDREKPASDQTGYEGKKRALFCTQSYLRSIYSSASTTVGWRPCCRDERRVSAWLADTNWPQWDVSGGRPGEANVP